MGSQPSEQHRAGREDQASQEAFLCASSVKRPSYYIRRKEHMAYSQRTKSLWLMARGSVVLISSNRPLL
jgi:hypothetical protein